MSDASSPESFLDHLDDALQACEFDRVGELTESIDPGLFSVDQATVALNMLRRKRRFCELGSMANAFIASGFDEPVFRRQLAQALIDQHRLDMAWRVLQVSDRLAPDDDPERPEITGLIGSTFKQKYVEGGESADLQKAVSAYTNGWQRRQGDYRWHGINLAALLKRAERDHVDVNAPESTAQIATRILAEIQQKRRSRELTVWDYGTAMEASFALGNEQDAIRWASQYVRHPGADAFELGGTLSQLQEVWQIDEAEIGRQLIPVFQYELLQRDGGRVPANAILEIQKDAFETIYGSEAYVRIEWLQSLSAITQGVARVHNTTTGEPFGTGFVVNGSDLCPAWGEAPVFVTNAHVLSDQAVDEAPLRPTEASVEFTRMPGRPKVVLGEKLYHSFRVNLDCWVSRITLPGNTPSLGTTFYNPLVPASGDRPQRIYVIGHPKGGELAVSMYGNDLVGYEIPYVHYKSPTEGGSSGSPVLNRGLKTFALHHKTREALRVNEGVLLEQIRQGLSD
ncbi:MAG: serine protease [Candidatus Thiodiazotropha sp.]